ncbi:lipopolysaccharide core heptosyltransferase RfaQ [soil metagenome]
MSIDWKKVNRVLVVRLRSIGDTVLATPSLIALRRFLPEAQIDILLEDWVAPVLEGFDAVDNVLTFKKDDLKSRLKMSLQIRRNKYDAVFNLHGGTTAGFFVRASSAKYRIGYDFYRYPRFHTHLFTSEDCLNFWHAKHLHSAEQQLALLGLVGIPVPDKPKSRLAVIQNSKFKIQNYALLHPVAAFDTKQWATGNFARVAEYLGEKGLQIVAVATKKEREVLGNLKNLAKVPILTFDDLTLPEITVLASNAKIFVGNDSGIAHIVAAVQTPSVVVFGSSNRTHWRPWTNAPNEIVYENLPCQPCAGYVCNEFDAPKCILSVKTESVIEAIEKVFDIK